jgi:hypothetical protein
MLQNSRPFSHPKLKKSREDMKEDIPSRELKNLEDFLIPLQQ